ncbi:MAG: hypothetical protein IKY44_00580, partial [Clostridia bacterium]|nr:hypothetical protein [Clostridia bacterium]
MKRIISFVLVLIFCFALTACNNMPEEVVPTYPNRPTTQSQQTTTLPDNTTTSTSPEDESTTTTTTKPVTTKPSTTTTTTTHVSADRVGLNIPRTEKITHYDINSSTFEITGKQE